MNINLEKLLKEQVNIISPTVKELVLQAMRNACNQTIDLCAENAKLTLHEFRDITFKEVYKGDTHIINDGAYVDIDKESILNTKNQIV